MSKEILISVIVPIYNLESYIENCVKSIQKQTYSNLEIILVDDGSKDNSRRIIEKLAEQDHRIVKVFKENGGVTSARLAGVERSTGEWIGFVDGDDEIEDDMYEMLLVNALKYHADISHCGYQMIFHDGRVNCFHNTGCLVKQDRITGIKELLDGSLIEPGLWNKLFHKTLLDNLFVTKSMNEDIQINEDLLMNYFLFSKAKCSIFEDRCKYHYIVRDNSASRGKLNEHKIFDPIWVKKIILENADEGIWETARKAYIGTCVNVYTLLAAERGYQKEKEEVRTMIMECHKDFHLIGKRTRILIEMICKMPSIYPFIYSVYSKYFQKRKYS